MFCMEVFLLLGNEPMCISVTAEPFPQLRKGEFRFRIGLIDPRALDVAA